MCLSSGEKRERDLLGVTDPSVGGISSDGKFVIYREGGGIHLRKTDGTSAVRLGEGSLQSLSPDGRWVLLLEAGPTPHLVLMPTGPGETKRVPVDTGGLEFAGADFLPGNRGFFCVVRSGKNGDPSLAVVGPDGGKLRMISAERLADRAVVASPEGDRLLYQTTDRRARIVPLSGAEGSIGARSASGRDRRDSHVE